MVALMLTAGEPWDFGGAPWKGEEGQLRVV